MPYARRRYGGFRRGGYRRKRMGRSTRVIAKRALYIARSIRQTQEVKHFDGRYFSNGSVNTIDAYNGVNLIQPLLQGTSDNTRIGDQINVKKIYVQWFIYQYPNPTTESLQPQQVTFGIVNTGPGPTPPASTSLFDYLGTGGVAGFAMLAEHNFPRPYTSLRRKKVMFGSAEDPRDTVAPVGSHGRQEIRHAEMIKFPGKGLHVEWEGSTQTWNNLCAYIYKSSYDPVNLPVVYADMVIRVYYVDS